MIGCSVLIPQRDAGKTLEQLVPAVCRVLEKLDHEYEVICVDDGSQAGPTLAILENLAGRFDRFRVIKLAEKQGLSAALAAGVAAARGEVVAAIEASNQYPPEEILRLLDRLARLDLVVGRRPRGRWVSMWRILPQLPRRILLGHEAHDPNCLLWAARREALAGLDLAPGMHRFLAELVAMRGFRVGKTSVEFRRVAAGYLRGETWPSFGNLLKTWRLARRWRSRLAAEKLAQQSGHKRIDPPQPSGPRHRSTGAFPAEQHSTRKLGRRH